MTTWRLVKLEICNAFMNMAIDEAILKARIKSIVPNTLRLYQWKPSAISIGRFQNLENEIYLDKCRELGVDVVRRITGGGAVYHEAEKEITYSVIASRETLGTEDIAAIYARIYGGLAEALKILGINADFSEGNAKTCPNLTVRSKKISGSAQSHKRGVVLQHGTLLVDVDLERMFTLLRVPWAESCMEIVNVAERKITSLKTELRRELSTKEVSRALVQGFQNAFNVELVCGELSSFEFEHAERLLKEKYGTEDWNFRGKSVHSQ